MASCLLALVALAVLSPQQPGGELRPKRSGGASSLVDGDVDDFAGLRRVHLTQAVDDSTPSPPPNGYARLVSPSPYPPPPPAPTPPNSPPPVIIGEDVGLPIALTGNVRVDAHNIALIDGLHELEHRWEPILATVLAVVLFCIHNLVVADNEYFSTDTRHQVNVICTGICFVVCGFAFIVFNKLVLLSVPLPCLITALQTGGTCLMLLAANGALSAILHSRTKRVLASLGGECSACCANTLSPCITGRDAAAASKAPTPTNNAKRRVSLPAAPAPAERARPGVCDPSAACCGLTCFGKRKWVGIKIGSSADVWRWMPAAVLYAGSHLFLVMALRDVTVTALVVWRQLAPIPTMVVESCLTNAICARTLSPLLASQPARPLGRGRPLSPSLAVARSPAPSLHLHLSISV